MIAAVILSVILHFWLIQWAREIIVEPMSSSYYDTIVPRSFHLQRAEIDPKLLEPAADPTPTTTIPDKIELPDARQELGSLPAEIQATPAAPPIDESVLEEKLSQIAPSLEETLKTATAVGASSLLEDNSALEKALLDDPGSPNAPPLDVSGNSLVTGPDAPLGTLAGEGPAGFSNLDELLARTGPLQKATAPILMPADLLFTYDSAALQTGAIESLEKLGRLIRKNPQALFTIEGHTDSFGSEEYNFDLSSRRAQNVKMWLVQSMEVPSDQIETVGYGKTRLIVPATKSIEEQQINRRVEIVIKNRQ